MWDCPGPRWCRSVADRSSTRGCSVGQACRPSAVVRGSGAARSSRPGAAWRKFQRERYAGRAHLSRRRRPVKLERRGWVSYYLALCSGNSTGPGAEAVALRAGLETGCIAEDRAGFVRYAPQLFPPRSDLRGLQEQGEADMERVTVVVLAAIALGAGAIAGGAEEPVKLGALYPLTGTGAVYGSPAPAWSRDGGGRDQRRRRHQRAQGGGGGARYQAEAGGGGGRRQGIDHQGRGGHPPRRPQLGGGPGRLRSGAPGKGDIHRHHPEDDPADHHQAAQVRLQDRGEYGRRGAGA